MRNTRWTFLPTAAAVLLLIASVGPARADEAARRRGDALLSALKKVDDRILGKHLLGIYHKSERSGQIEVIVKRGQLPDGEGYRVFMTVEMTAGKKARSKVTVDATMRPNLQLTLARGTQETVRRNGSRSLRTSTRTSLTLEGSFYQFVKTQRLDDEAPLTLVESFAAEQRMVLNALHFPFSRLLLGIERGKPVEMRTVDAWTGSKETVRYTREPDEIRTIRGRKLAVVPIQMSEIDSRFPDRNLAQLYLEPTSGQILEARTTTAPLVVLYGIRERRIQQPANGNPRKTHE